MATILNDFSSYLTIGNAICAFILLYFLHYVKVLYEFRGMPPGPRFSCLPLVGNIFVGPERLFEDSKDSLHRVYGRVCSIKLGDYKIVSATSAESIKEALVKKSADFSGRPPTHGLTVQTLGGKDIAYGYGPAWKYHRKVLFTALRQYLSDIPLLESRMQTQANKLIDYINECNQQPFNPERILATCLGDVLCSYTFDKYFDSTQPVFHEFLRVLDDALALEMNSDMFLLDMFTISKYLPLDTYKRNEKITQRMFDVMKRVFTDKQEDVRANKSSDSNDFMSTLLKLRNEAEQTGDEQAQEFLHDDYVLNSLIDMFSAGYETTTTTLKWGILFMVNYPQYQTEIQDAIDKVVGHDRSPTLEDRPRLRIIEANIMETLRVGNTSPFTIPHYSTKDTTLCGYRIPKDTIIVINLEMMHKDPDVWENPDVYDPHRHLDSNGQIVLDHGNLIPFSAGMRICAGMAFAKTVLFKFLACILQKYTFVAEEGKPPPSVEAARDRAVLSPLPYKIRAIRRKNI